MESTTTQSNEVCSVCGKSYSAHDVVHYENDTICFNCKNVYFQKVREGVGGNKNSEMIYASISKRFLASVVDGLITYIMLIAISLILTGSITSMFRPAAEGAQALGSAALFSFFVPQILSALYYVLFLGWRGATPGKMLLKIKVVRPDGSPISYGASFLRYIGVFISSIILMMGYIMAFFDKENRTLHDRIAGTRVIEL